MRNDRGHSIGAGVPVWTDCLGLACTRTAIRISYERIFDVGPVDGSVRMPAAVLCTETGSLVHIRRGEDEVNAIGVFSQPVIDRPCDDCLDVSIPQRLPPAVIIGCGAGQ